MYETDVLRADGTVAHCLVSHSPVSGYEEFLVILKDITERRRAEDKIKEQAALLDVDPAAISVIDPEGRVLFWNRSAEAIYGWERARMVGTSIKGRLTAERKSTFEEARKTVLERGRWQGEWIHHAEGEIELVIESDWTLVRNDDGTPRFIYVVDSDVTQKKKLEEQVLRAQRMESLGMIAGGIAHELNNVLGPILLSIELIRREVTDERTKRLLGTIESSSKRASDIVKQILAFARGEEEKPKDVVSSRQLLRDVEILVARTFPKSIRVESRLPEDLWPIHGNGTLLQQVLLNLCINAKDAMDSGGTLVLEGENHFLDEHYARLRPHVLPGPFVVLSVTDTGVGIPADKVGRIFEPFFTTKGKGKGTGLGLSVAAGIVQNHGGFINVYSEPDKGTSFKVYLPAARTPEIDMTVEERRHLPHGNGETILVVEDEPMVLELTKQILESHGYRALGAADGTEAMALYAEHKGRIALVLCDMAMPFMDGPATIRAITKMNPSARIVVVSGFADLGKSLDDFRKNVHAFVAKPYSAEKILGAIKDALKSTAR